MKFRRGETLPPYVFAQINDLKRELRRAGRDVIDLGFGNPDIPSPDVAVEKLREAALRPTNHRYSVSRGLPQLRAALAEVYDRRFGVTLDPETQVVATIGAKEALSRRMGVLVERGDAAIVPSPSYPIHLFAPVFAGATTVEAELTPSFVDAVIDAYERTLPRPRVAILSFPHNPTTATATREDLQRLVDFALERGDLLVHDFAYAGIAFDGYRPPSLLEIPGALDCSVELYSLTKSF